MLRVLPQNGEASCRNPTPQLEQLTRSQFIGRLPLDAVPMRVLGANGMPFTAAAARH